jgi:hypothetical protein
MKTKPSVVDQGLVFDGLLFNTHRDRGLYIRESRRDRPRWLKEHPDVWKRLQDIEEETSSSPRRVESDTPIEATAAGPSPHMSSSDVRKDGQAADNAGSVEVPAGEPPPPQELLLAMTRPETDAAASVPGDEIAIDGRGYVSADRAAYMLGISRRTLSRRCAAGKGPPKIKHGNMAYFEIAKVPG